MAGSPSHRVLVTGAGGFVGSWLIERLVAGLPAGSALMAAGLPDREGVRGASLDITHRAEVDAVVADFRPTCVVHLAGMASLNEARIEVRKAWEVNLFGTMNMADAVLRHAPEARFIHAGSSEVYGGSFNAVGGVADESVLLDPRNPYASTKAAADLMLGQMAEAGLHAVRFRPFNHTGPRQSTQFAIPAFAAQIAAIERGEQSPVLKVGNLEARRDLSDVRDVVDAYFAAILVPDLPRGTVFNIASGMARRMGDVLDTLLGLSSVAVSVECDPDLMRPTDVPVSAGDARRARDLLRWQPAIPFETTLRDILDFYRGGRAPQPARRDR